MLISSFSYASIAKPELNGRFGQAVSFSAGRYVVAIIDASTAAAAAATGNDSNAQPTSFLKLKPENLTEAGNMDQLKFGASMMVQTAKAYIVSPTAQNLGKQIIDKLPAAIKSKMTPNRALFGLAIAANVMLYILYLIIGKLIGGTKVFVLLSLMALVLAVSSPDWMEGYKANKPLNLIVRNSIINFRRRWKENLQLMTGYNNISDNMALASLVFVLLFSGKVLLTRSPSASRLPPKYVPNTNIQTAPPQYDLEHIYKLGYDDAKSGSDFGMSLPDDIIKYNAAQEVPLDQYDGSSSSAHNYDDYEYSPPMPPPPRKSSFGMGSMLSLMTLYRFGKDLVTTPDGQVVMDPQYVMAQLRSIETWRLGLLAMSAYRVVSALSSFVR